jgi:hypothetical protein
MKYIFQFTDVDLTYMTLFWGQPAHKANNCTTAICELSIANVVASVSHNSMGLLCLLGG